jgi:RNA polymerase sigma factor (sigma-70 family)
MDAATRAHWKEARRKIPGWAGALAATRESLLTRLKDFQDHDGWQRFYDTYGGAIYGLAQRSGLSAAESEDVLQETLCSIAREMPGFRYDSARGKFKSWLFQITRRRIADQFRARARRRHEISEAAETLEQVADPQSAALEQIWDDEWRRNQLQLAVERVKAQVAPRQWQMFDLAALQKWPTEKICGLLGINRAQLYMAKMRVGRLLKAELARAEHFEPDG